MPLRTYVRVLEAPRPLVVRVPARFYLGDGWVSSKGQLVIVCDTLYPEIIEECSGAIVLTSLRRHVGIHPHREFRCVRVTCSWQGWFAAFPQHGPGRKHDRPIVLEPWQQAIVEAHPWQ